MNYLIEDLSTLDAVKLSCQQTGAFISVISSNDNYHPKLTTTVAVYIHGIGQPEGYIIPVDHSEGFNIGKKRLSATLDQIPIVYTVNKKELLYHFNLQKAVDISLLHSMKKYEKLEYITVSEYLSTFYLKYKDIEIVNKIIPLSKLYEYGKKLYSKVSEHITTELPDGFNFYNNIATNVFYLIEQTGLEIPLESYKNLFTPKNIKYNYRDGIVYTSYNLYNSTSRPTNAFNSVNFVAIPKTREHRECITPQNDNFIEYDFDGYHLRLLAEQIEYNFTEESAHEQLARLYFGKQEVTEEEYSQAKQINFQAIYGKIPEEHKNLEIFQKIQEYITEMWRMYNQEGFVCNPQSGKAFTRNLKDMHPQKLMNYMMQSLETSRNILILKDVLRYLKDKKTKIVLYTYDSIVVDLSLGDGKEVPNTILKIMEEGGKFPVKNKIGTNLILENI